MILGPLTRVASLLQEVVLHCGGLEPLLLPACTCILRGIRKFGSKLSHKSIFREAMYQVVASFEKAVGVRPSPLQLVRAMNSTVWKPVQHGSSPDSGPPGDQQVGVQSLSTSGDCERTLSTWMFRGGTLWHGPHRNAERASVRGTVCRRARHEPTSVGTQLTQARRIRSSLSNFV